MTDLPPPPAHVAIWADVLGDRTPEFLMRFGGAEIYIARRPGETSMLVEFLGRELADRLAARADRLPAQVPTAKPWLAEVMRQQGLPVAEIARRLHTTEATIRRMRRNAEAERLRKAQPSLF